MRNIPSNLMKGNSTPLGKSDKSMCRMKSNTRSDRYLDIVCLANCMNIQLGNLYKMKIQLY